MTKTTKRLSQSTLTNIANTYNTFATRRKIGVKLNATETGIEFLTEAGSLIWHYEAIAGIDATDYAIEVEKELNKMEDKMKTSEDYLNDGEAQFMVSAAQEIVDCTDGQFGFTSDMKVPAGYAKSQKSGYISQLVQKGLLWVEDDTHQMMLTEAGAKWLDANTTRFEGKAFELIGKTNWYVMKNPESVEAAECEANCKNGNCGQYQTKHIEGCEFAKTERRPKIDAQEVPAAELNIPLSTKTEPQTTEEKVHASLAARFTAGELAVGELTVNAMTMLSPELYEAAFETVGCPERQLDTYCSICGACHGPQMEFSIGRVDTYKASNPVIQVLATDGTEIWFEQCVTSLDYTIHRVAAGFPCTRILKSCEANAILEMLREFEIPEQPAVTRDGLLESIAAWRVDDTAGAEAAARIFDRVEGFLRGMPETK